MTTGLFLVAVARCDRRAVPVEPLNNLASNAAPSDPGSTQFAPTATRPAVPHFVEVPDPLSGDNPRYPLVSQPPPDPGQSITDARFETTIRRVGRTERLRHEYSRHDPFNRGGTLILLRYLPEGEWRVYRTSGVPYDQPGQLVRTLDLAEPRWDADDANLIWGFQEFRIVTVQVTTGATVVVKDFSKDARLSPILTAHPDLYRITMKDEGEPSVDMRYWAMLLQGSQDDYRVRWLLTWDRDTDRILGLRELPTAESRIDWVGMSPRGNWVLVGGDHDNGGSLAGLTLADRELTTFHMLERDTAHADVGLDVTGREVIVMQSTRSDTIDLLPIDPKTKPVDGPEDPIEGTGRVRLIRLFYDSQSPLNLNSGVHISCNAPGYCVVSSFIEPGRPEQNWLDRSIVLVRLDPQHPRVIYLAKVHGTAGAYWEETQAAISRDARRVVWATNWNRDVGQERVWLMELEVPEALCLTLEQQESHRTHTGDGTRYLLDTEAGSRSIPVGRMLPR